ncbi:NAD(P)-binding domain-containing protein [Engelhardtia mirabilis]|uniref:Ferredoxin--NADP reductase n=1 Tax=Engelhardtia mirabilis TaxID=2528011 RepID=A0A518BN65_9BACT|nr:Ferredoxin--NADP reductase [Planctomycetes bacterium Pla133]QDV02746.1 Ferredoxin--NADP reductase [Planctomycetes bacterium Pla86]
MGWAVLIGLVAALGAALGGVALRRVDRREQHQTLRARHKAERTGAAAAELQHPVVDLTRCLGCGTCVRACPEEGVLDLLHGQAVVVRGSGCVGTAACARECPTGAITVTLTDLATRRDVPVLDEGLEAVGQRGLFLAGEVTAHALVKTAVDHGVLVARTVAERVGGERAPNALDLVIVGAGPGGLACALEARRLGLDFALLERESDVGGTVARYPRRKLVATQPIDLPLHGRLPQRTYLKEELIELWQSLARDHELPVECGVTFEGVERSADGLFEVRTSKGPRRARNVCLAIGRRGLPNRLGVPGEDRPWVAYSLLDADAWEGRRILVVGGGDSAVEAALGLTARGANDVTLSYRRAELFRLKPSNERRIAAAIAEGRVRALFESQVLAIDEGQVRLSVGADGAREELVLPTDAVFVMVGGTPPIAQLEAAGVSFDPALRPAAAALGEQGTGLVKALAAGFVIALLGLAFALWHRDYYTLPAGLRAAHTKHDELRPGLGLGLWLGVGSIALVLANLLYILRRSPRFPLRLGSLAGWMTLHVATGVLALLAALLHGGMQPRDTVGGHAFWALAALFATGAIGRYLYAYVPRAANGRELELAELRGRLTRVAEGFDRVHPRLAALVRDEVGGLVERRQWKASLPARLLALVGAETGLRRLLRQVRHEGLVAGLASDQIDEVTGLARSAHRAALATAHIDDLRGLMESWRWLHRWAAVLLLALIAIHVVYALAYGAHLFDGGLT